MEGPVQRPRWPTITRHQLLGDMRSGHHLTNHLFLLCIGNHQGLANMPNRLRIGIYPSSGRGPTVHEVSSRIRKQVSS